MTLSLTELVDIQAECMADDLEIDLTYMSRWTREQAVMYFESGGQEEPPALPSPQSASSPAAPMTPPTSVCGTAPPSADNVTAAVAAAAKCSEAVKMEPMPSETGDSMFDLLRSMFKDDTTNKMGRACFFF